jgi:hypothetical protein
MPEDKHHPGPVVSVLADDTGQVVCCRCNEVVDADHIYLLLKVPGAYYWAACCEPCTRTIATVLIAADDLAKVGISLAVL